MKKRNRSAVFLRNLVIYAVCGTLLVLLFALCTQSLLTTYDVNTQNSMKENVVLHYDILPLNLLLLAVGLLLLFLLRKWAVKVRRGVFTGVLLGWTVAAGLVWLLCSQSSPTLDSYEVTHAAQLCANGDCSVIDSDYFRHFPFQLGYVLWSEIFIRLFRLNGYYLPLEFVNVLFLALAYYALLRIVRCIFPGETVHRLTVLLLFACVPPVLFCTFLYGNIPGLAFAALGLWMTVAFLQKHRWYFAVLGALFIGISVMLKLNNMIVLIAVLALVFVDMLCEKKWSSLLYIALAVVCSLGLKTAATVSYEKRAGVDLGDGIPMLSWLAMGFSEGKIMYGWYNGTYTKINYDNNDMDAARASEDSAAVIRERLQTFADDPAYTVDFFTQKFFSQWNEPSYQSIWTNEVRGFYGGRENRAALAAWVGGDGERLVKGYMNAFQQLIFAGALLAALFCLRKKNYGGSLLFLVLLGGMLYHLLFEAKAQYAITYFILLIPLAAYGVDEALQLGETTLQKWKNRKELSNSNQ